MAKTDLERGGQLTSWRNPVLRFAGTTKAPAEAVYDLLADLHSHLEWAGQRQLETTRLLTMEAPPGPAGIGTEFFTTGSDGKSPGGRTGRRPPAPRCSSSSTKGAGRESLAADPGSPQSCTGTNSLRKATAVG
jgi:hypothetical protein